MFEIHEGVISKPLKVVLYAVEGLGKSTFASYFPNPLYIDTEGSTAFLNVRRLENPSSWAMLVQEVDYVIANPSICSTLVIDTIDWAERLCIQHVCAKNKWDGLESAGYGKAYTFLMEEMGRFLDKLSLANDRGLNIVVLAHAFMRTVTLPEETGSYDRWELKMQKKTSPLVKEWADMLLFGNYKTMLIKDEKSGKTKAHGGQRVMYTSHTTNWDAKNRFGLPEELPFDYAQIANLIPSAPSVPSSVVQEAPPMQSVPENTPPAVNHSEPIPDVPPAQPEPTNWPTPSHSKLYAMMRNDSIDEGMLCAAIEHLQYYPQGTPMVAYAPDFIEGFILPNWKDVSEMAKQLSDLPF